MEILRLEETGIDPAVKRAAAVLKAGGIVLYPTDTLYGLGVDATNPAAVVRLKALKGRETRKPLSVIVPDLKGIESCGVMTARAKELAARFLPGPLTLVLRARSSMPEDVMLHGNIGVRIPNYPFCLALAKAFKKPFTTTSANLSGQGTPSSVADLIWHFGPKVSEVDLVIDAGTLENRSPSTVVSCVGETPQVLRDGAISREELGL